MFGSNVPGWLYRRTRLLNVLHRFGLAHAHSQMSAAERICLSKHAEGKQCALEIGTYMGVSGNLIASAISDEGLLHCLDPFPDRNGRKNPGLEMAERDLKRNKVERKVVFLNGFSSDPEIVAQIPMELDFIFVDGDHSLDGIRNDWRIVSERLTKGGVVCLHDAVVPSGATPAGFGSEIFYRDVISVDSLFEAVEECHTMAVLRRQNVV
jgi:predicted O-methyltransferase YrrM